MDLVPHLWDVFKLGPFDVVLEFHEPVSITEAGTRKALARYCEDKVAEGVSRAISGRDDAGRKAA
jgi:1-acyl-sn-glycerol-3-phosphate acyltransferase